MKTNITKEEAKRALVDKELEAEEMLKDKEQTHETLKNAEGLLEKIKKLPVIGKLADDIATSIELIRDFIDGRYRRIPTRVIVSTFAGLLYILSPIDLIPDVIPVVGWLDDAAVFSLILSTGLSVELNEYRRWKEAQKGKPGFKKVWIDDEELEN